MHRDFGNTGDLNRKKRRHRMRWYHKHSTLSTWTASARSNAQTCKHTASLHDLCEGSPYFRSVMELLTALLMNIDTENISTCMKKTDDGEEDADRC